MIKCPNCGAEVAATAKFCKVCGFALKPQPATPVQPAQPQATQTQQPAVPQQPQVDPAVAAEQERQRQLAAQKRAEQMDRLKQSSRGYWTYLVDSWKAPSQVIGKTYNKWFGLISMGIWAVIGTIAVGSATQAGVNSVTNTTSSVTSLLGGDSSTASSINGEVQNTATAIYFKFFLLMVVGMLVFGAIGFMFRRWAQNEEISFLDYTTDLMHRGNLNIILVCIAMILGLIGGFIQLLSLLIVSLGTSIYTVGFMQSIIVPKPRAKGFDSVYLTVLALFCLNLALFVVVMIFGKSMISSVTSMFGM